MENNSSVVNTRPKRAKGQTQESVLKYREAIRACKDLDHIGLNVSQIARMYGLDGTALANQLRRHFPCVLPYRERLRHKLGLNDNIHRGVRPWCELSYASAVEVLRSNSLTVVAAAELCGVSYKGLKEHLSYYHPELVEDRSLRRESGEWPSEHSAMRVGDKYSEAVELYRTSSMSLAQIAKQSGIGEGGLRNHLHKWHPELVAQRRGYALGTTLKYTKRYSKAAREKYAQAIERLRAERISLRGLAAEYGFCSESFRKYIIEHHPELAARRRKK